MSARQRRRCVGAILCASTVACGSSSSATLTYNTLPRPLFMVDIEDGVCSSMVLLDGSDQLWTSATCDGQTTDAGLVKTIKASSGDAAQVQALFAALPSSPQLNCPADDSDASVAAQGGSSSGTAIPLADGNTDSFITLELESAQANEIWAACQAQGVILEPFKDAVDFLRGLAGE